jgi:hypothetical protein
MQENLSDMICSSHLHESTGATKMLRGMLPITVSLALLFLLMPPRTCPAGERGWSIDGQFNWYTPGKFGRVGSPSAGDLDGDGNREITVLMTKYAQGGNFATEIHVFDKDGNPYGGTWPVRIAGESLFGNVAASAPMIANVDNSDAELEIIVTLYNHSTDTFKIHVLNHDGTFFWNTPFERVITHTGLNSGSPDFSPGAVGDLNDDGLIEIVAAVGDEIFVIEPDKSTLFEVKLNEDTHLITSAPALADLNQDGKPEVILNFDRYYAWQSDGTSIPGWPIDIPGTTGIPAYCISPVVGDLDNDGDYEVVFSDIWAHPFEFKKWIYAYHHNGTVVNGWPVEEIGVGGADRFNSPALADIDNDGKPEVITLRAGSDSGVCVYHHDASMAAGWPQKVNLNGITSLYYISNSFTPSVGDLDGDGEVEIMVVAKDRNNDYVPAIYLFNADGTEAVNFPLPTESGCMLDSIPSIVDLDNDRRAEILFSHYIITGATGGQVTWHLRLVDEPAWQTFDEWKMPWTTFQRDLHHTGTLPSGFGPFPHLDIKCNGGDRDVVVAGGSLATLTIEVESRDYAGLPVDLWVAARNPASGGAWTHGYHGAAIWNAGWGNVYFTGGLADHFDTVLDQYLPVGNYLAYLAIDLDPNGILDIPFLWDHDVVDFEVLP